MSAKITFNKIKSYNIFQSEFEDFEKNGHNEILFKENAYSQGGIAVIYAPNGTGKTSLSRILGLKQSTDDETFEAKYNGKPISPEDNFFHVIEDQLNRNIIQGNSSDYLVGENIKKEYELKRKIDKTFLDNFTQKLPRILKDSYKITKISSCLLAKIQEDNSEAYGYIKDIVNTQKRGSSINRDNFIFFIKDLNNKRNVVALDESKKSFIINDMANNAILDNISQININDICKNNEIDVIECDDIAINILEKYKEHKHCIVCDNVDFDGESILKRKVEHRKVTYEKLNETTKKIFDEILNDNFLNKEDPFEIKRILKSFISGENTDELELLISEYKIYLKNIINEIVNIIINVFSEDSLIEDYDEYNRMKETDPVITDDDLLYIQQVVSDSLGKRITFKRNDEDRGVFTLLLDNKTFIGKEVKNLHLSSGQQNFISLAFELLLARLSDKEIIVLDDPISSFDSIYKNKIAFCIVKFLEKKKQIVFTHNTDLVRLLEVQQNGCFNLYLFNNIFEGDNGFIFVNEKERKLLINLYELIKFLQNKEGNLSDIILDERAFLISMIPFMRGYSHILLDKNNIYSDLSCLMHGYSNTSIDISETYKLLFDHNFSKQIVSVSDILSFNYKDIKIIDSSKYPLLAETLQQTIAYYCLRMKVEKELVDIFGITINPNDPQTLNQIIQKALGSKQGETEEMKNQKLKDRVFLTSRKTLINEFNHFEGNMNIFQPAIDIKPDSLNEECLAVEKKLLEIRKRYLPIQAEI